MGSAIDRSVFDDLYRDGADPWSFETSEYEARKRAITLASLPRRRYRRVFEPGCSIGTLTGSLADRCDQLLAADVSERAVTRTRARLAGRAGVRVEQIEVPLAWPTGTFDLIVLSELGYFLAPVELDALLDHAVPGLERVVHHEEAEFLLEVFRR